ncbi:MAG: hypothetical protein PHX04_01880 [Bacilli bacterium]|nr:hypothetical protein [Bacilli bacterium]
MKNIIERIEQATEKSIMPLIYLALHDSLIAVSWNNHDINRGAEPIDVEFHQRLREVSMAKLLSFGVKSEQLQSWYDVFAARFETFGIFSRHIISQIIDGTISEARLKKLFAKDSDISNDEIYRIADEYSDMDCALARELGYETCSPLYSADDQLVIRKTRSSHSK